MRNQTLSFQTQCEDLVSEEQRLESLSTQIGQGLAPFAELEKMVTKLNRPGTDFVKTRSFSDMLMTLDWCLEDLGRYVCYLTLVAVGLHVYVNRMNGLVPLQRYPHIFASIPSMHDNIIDSDTELSC